MSDETPKPEPTQAEADEFKEQVHGVADESEPATAPPVNVDVPYVSGTGTVGSTLNCTMGNWQNTPTSYAYAWKSDGATDVGTGSSYVVAATDAGHSVTCVVTARMRLANRSAVERNRDNLERLRCTG
jgi:hypothetical protein